MDYHFFGKKALKKGSEADCTYSGYKRADPELYPGYP